MDFVLSLLLFFLAWPFKHESSNDDVGLLVGDQFGFYSSQRILNA